MVADAYFSKTPFMEATLASDMHFISRLRDDSVLFYTYKGGPREKKVARKSMMEELLPIP